MILAHRGRARLAARPARALLLLWLILATACATSGGPALPAAGEPGAATAGFVFARDSFAFANEIRSRHPDADDLYANYCFVLARGLRQFFRFTRFEPAAPRLDHAGYVARVRQVVERAPWEPSLARAERIVIPGYASLREFSRLEETAVKEGLGGRFWTLVHWSNWRVTLPVTRAHQEAVAAEIADRLGHGQLVQLLVTNWPTPELNHTVVAYASRPAVERVDFDVWDPNDPAEPGVISFDRGTRRFWATRVYDTRPGVIRVFRMYYSPWL